MSRFAATLALLLVPLVAQAQTVTIPQSVLVSKGRLAQVTITYDGDDLKWIVPPELDSFREWSPDPKVVSLRVLGYTDGTYQLSAITCKGGKLSEFAKCLIVVGKGPGPTPVPIPPPDPEPQPDPTPLAGPRTVLLIRETADTTPEQARLVTALRTQHAEYLRSKGHTVNILDDDSLGADGKPALESWRPIMAGIKLPWLIITDAKTRAVLEKRTAPATAEEIVEAIKKSGG